MNNSALNAFLQELKTSINKLESVLINHQEPVKDSSLWFPPADKNYGPWLPHSGNIPPVPYGTKIQRLSHAERHDRRFAARSEESASDLWHDGIVAYRLKKEQPFVFVPEEEYEEYEEDDEPVTKKKLIARKAAKKTAIRKKLWYPAEECEDFGPWIENNGVDYRKLASGTRGQILTSSERSAKSWNKCTMNFDEVYFEKSDEDYVVAYRILKEKPWYPADYVFGPWVETKGRDFHLHPDTRIQILTKDERDNKRSGKNPSICVYSHVKNSASTPSYKDIVAYRIVTEQH